MKTRVSLYVRALVALMVLTVGVACTKAPNDAQISSDVQNKLNADSGLQSKQLSVQADNGAVTLSGSVDSEAQREAAARYAASVPGVKQVINNLQVAPAAAMTAAPPPVEEAPPAPRPKPSKPAPSHKRHHSDDDDVAHSTVSNPPSNNSMSSAAPAAAATTPAAPTPPPPPQKVTIASGTTLAVRLVDAIDSETATQGQTFHATLNSPLAVDGEVAIPSGYDVEGHVVEVQSAGKFAGKSVVTLQLDRITVGSKSYNLNTDTWHKEGSSRGKNTAAKVGAGAAIGAIIGGIAGGGKGAGIGAAAGGGLGGGVQAATKGQQIKLPSETVLNFTLQSALTVIPAKGRQENRPKLDTGSSMDSGPNNN